MLSKVGAVETVKLIFNFAGSEGHQEREAEGKLNKAGQAKKMVSYPEN